VYGPIFPYPYDPLRFIVELLVPISLWFSFGYLSFNFTGGSPVCNRRTVFFHLHPWLIKPVSGFAMTLGASSLWPKFVPSRIPKVTNQLYLNTLDALTSLLVA